MRFCCIALPFMRFCFLDLPYFCFFSSKMLGNRHLIFTFVNVFNAHTY